MKKQTSSTATQTKKSLSIHYFVSYANMANKINRIITAAAAAAWFACCMLGFYLKLDNKIICYLLFAIYCNCACVRVHCDDDVDGNK